MLYEYERSEFLDLVKSVTALTKEDEQVFYRQPFRWFRNHQPLPNCYEMCQPSSIAKANGVEIIRSYGAHIFVGKSPAPPAKEDK